MRTLAVAALLLAAAATPAAAQTTGAIATGMPTLKPEVTVESDIVRIGDLVANAGAHADIAIFRAPDLGETGTVRAAQVADALMRNGLFDLDTRGMAEIAVTRASRTIETAEIEARIARALAGRYSLGAAENVAIAFDRDVRPIRTDPAARADLRVTRMHYEPGSRRFDLTFELAGAGSERPRFLRYTGTAYEAVEAAVLRHPVARGEIIRADHIAVERRARAEIGGAAPALASEAVGMAARRALRAGDALRTGDLAKPELVQRNESVTLVLETPGLVLTLRGKALEAGSLGEVVNVLNIHSKRTIPGVVSGPGRVTVAAATPRLAAAAAEPRNPARRTQ